MGSSALKIYITIWVHTIRFWWWVIVPKHGVRNRLFDNLFGVWKSLKELTIKAFSLQSLPAVVWRSLSLRRTAMRRGGTWKSMSTQWNACKTGNGGGSSQCAALKRNVFQLCGHPTKLKNWCLASMSSSFLPLWCCLREGLRVIEAISIDHSSADVRWIIQHYSSSLLNKTSVYFVLLRLTVVIYLGPVILSLYSSLLSIWV